MKKLTKISLKDAAVLDDKQLKSIYGGSGSGSSTCKSSESQCSGSCTGGDGASGTCKWVKVWSECRCATISVG